MNHCVPDFEFDDDYSIPTSSALTRPKKSVMPEDGVMELLWQNGQVVMQSQNQRSLKKSQPSKFNGGADQSTSREIHSSHQHQQQQQQQQQQHEHHQQEHLFMQEDEMASWLHYPTNDTNFDTEFWADLLYPAPCVASTTTATATVTAATATPPARAAHVIESRPQLNGITTAAPDSAPRPPIPPPRRTENFGHFSRQRLRADVSGPSNSKSVVIRESTIVDSSDTPAVGPQSRVSTVVKSTEGASGVNSRLGNMSSAGVAGTSSGGGGGGSGSSGARDLATCEMTVTSSPGGSCASAEPPAQKLPNEDRKRKGRENDDEYHSEDAELESADAKKQTRGSSSTKRSRAAEVHNLSERRRRDRINEKMRSLQELIPRCNKSDKASMLDEAIEYLKSLQLQVQMMSMGCGMVPMMFPGVQPYMPNMGMGIGMGMGMDMGMSRPMIPFPNVLAGSAMPTPAATAHLGPRFPMPAFHMPPVPGADTTRVQAANQSDPMLNSFGMQNPSQPRGTTFVDPYQQYLALHHMQLQNQSMVPPNASKPSSSKGAENPENHPSG